MAFALAKLHRSTLRSMGIKIFMPWHLSVVARTHGQLGQFDEARQCIGEAMTVIETTRKGRAKLVHRIAGGIALISPEQGPKIAQHYFERSLTVARQQQAKSWSLRAAMSMARLWRDQGFGTQNCLKESPPVLE